MAINKKLIHFKNKENFDNEVANGNILDTSIVFIQDSKEIWNHGTYFDGSTFDPTDIEASILNILDTKADKTEIPTKVSQLENDVPYAVDEAIPENGVYAVRADGSLCTVEEADELCVAVALIQDEHKFWIEKNETKNTETYKAAYNEFGATNTGYTNLYWGGYGTDQTGIPTYNKADASNSNGYLPQANGSYNSTPNLSGDYTTWTSGALSDFNGKANSDVIKTITTNGTSSSKSYAPMGILLNKFNDANNEENGGYTDWYIPACGQLSLMYLNMTAINNALTKIGGQTIASHGYWSSSEYNLNYGWYVDFSNGSVNYGYKKYGGYRVRFVRDFTPTKPLKERVSEIESQIEEILMQL